MNTLLRILPLLILFFVGAALGLGMLKQEEKTSPIDNTRNGQTIAHFEIPSLGKTTNFSPKLFGDGRVLVLNVFASWCEPCSSEHNLLMKLAHKVNMYGIAWKDKPDAVFNYIKERGNPFQEVGMDAEGKTTVLLGLSGVPETYVLNKKGEIVFHYKAPIDEELLNKVLIPLVEKLHNEDATAH